MKQPNLYRRSLQIAKDYAHAEAQFANGWLRLARRERAIVAALGNVIALVEANEEQSDEPEDQAVLCSAKREYERRSKNLFEPIVIRPARRGRRAR